jgi:hypothetical protein
MWFMIILSRESVSSLEYPVKLLNVPEGMALLNKPDSIVTFRISKGGLEMFVLKYFSRRKPLEIDLSTIDLKPQNQSFVGSLPTALLVSSLPGRYMLSEELISISPTVISFRFELLSWKMVPVVPNVTVTFQKSFKQTGVIRAVPDSVKLVAPQGVLDHIWHAETVPVSLREISGEVRLEADVSALVTEGNMNVTAYPSKVELIIPTEKFTEITIELPVESEFSDIGLKAFPDRVEVTFWVALSDYGRISDGMFKAVADISESPDKNRAPVKLVSVPSFVEVIKTEPREVEFLLFDND